MTADRRRAARRDGLLLLGLFLAAAALHGLVGNYDRQIAIYQDEWYYYSIADSLRAGLGVQVQGMPLSFQKIGYSLLMAPFFGIHDPVLRVRLMGWLNSLVMMSWVFPIWLIGRETGLRKGYRWLVCALACILPETLLTVTFMAENLYYPLVMWCVWLWLVTRRTGRWQLALLGGLAGCLTYLVKEAFLALAAAFVILDLVRFFRSRRKDRAWDRRQLTCLAVYALTLLGLSALIRFTAFSDMRYSYERQVSFAFLTDPEKVKYLFYAILYYAAATLCILLAVPFPFALAGRFRMEERMRVLLDLIFLYLGVTLLFIGITICVPEVFGNPIPNFHLRYYTPALVLILIPFMMTAQQGREDGGKRFFLRAAVLSAVSLTLVALVYRGNNYGSVVDQFSLAWFDEIYWRFQIRGREMIAVWILVGCLTAFLILSLLLVRFGKTRLTALFTAGVLAVTAAVDWQILIPRLQRNYLTDPSLKGEVLAVNAALAEVPGDRTLLVLADSGTDPFVRHCIDTYLDVPCAVTVLRYVNRAQNQTDALVTVPSGRTDYLLVGGKSLTDHYTFPDCELMKSGESGELLLFRCLAPEQITMSLRDDRFLTDASTWDEPLEICFFGEGYNADFFVTSGVYGPELGFSWTQGHEVHFSVRAEKAYETVNAALEVGEPFNGPQPFEVWCGGEMVMRSEVFEPDSFLFSLHPEGDTVEFSIRLPEAVEISSVRPGSEDGRCVALQLHRLMLWTEEE